MFGAVTFTGQIPGIWSAAILLAALVGWKQKIVRVALSELEIRQKQLEKERLILTQEYERKEVSVREQERSILELSELYGLSKQLLATLDLEQALRVSEEALARWLPRVSAEERTAYLIRLHTLVENAEISMESLLRAMSFAGQSENSSENWGIVGGQLALGLRRISLYHQVQQSAIHDGLTGLLVRRHFRERLDEEVERSIRRKTPLAFLMVDLDHFKQINDTFGHLVGDVVLREVAQRIRRSVREGDLVGRYGGEEFGVVLPEANQELGLQIADRIRQTVEQAAIRAYDESVQVTVSVGVAMCPEGAREVDQLIEQADQAMYEAKGMGRNQTVLFRKGTGRS